MRKNLSLSGVLLLTIAVTLSLESCKIENTDEIQGYLGSELTPSTVGKNADPINITDWRSQLQTIIDAPPDIMRESGISLSGFALVGKIGENIDVATAKLLLKSDENMIPAYTSDFKKVRAITKSEAANLGNDHCRYMFDKCEEYIDYYVSDGMELLTLKWSCNGKETTSYCLVSHEAGIVYDNFIVNTFIVNEPVVTNAITSTAVSEFKKDGVASEQIVPSFSGFVNWGFSITADWLWGSERGEAYVTHTGHYYNDRYLRHDYRASHYITLGNSDAKVTEIANNRIAYGLALSTPMIKITINFSYGAYSVSFGSMIGSTAGETGSHSHSMIYAQ